MTDFGLFAERDPGRAARILARLERFAKRRELLLAHIDLDLLDRASAFAILEADDALTEALAFGPLYIHHLETLARQRAALRASLPHAA